ncbi:hypothetical protein, partial [Psychrobacter sp. CAL346-MNA-CIBAN-0220]
LYVDEYAILLYDFKAEINHYLSQTPTQVTVKSLDDLIAFNTANKKQEMLYFEQDILQQANAVDLSEKQQYQKTKARYRALANRAISNLYRNNKLD